MSGDVFFHLTHQQTRRRKLSATGYATKLDECNGGKAAVRASGTRGQRKRRWHLEQRSGEAAKVNSG